MACSSLSEFDRIGLPIAAQLPTFSGGCYRYHIANLLGGLFLLWLVVFFVYLLVCTSPTFSFIPVYLFFSRYVFRQPNTVVITTVYHSFLLYFNLLPFRSTISYMNRDDTTADFLLLPHWFYFVSMGCTYSYLCLCETINQLMGSFGS